MPRLSPRTKHVVPTKISVLIYVLLSDLYSVAIYEAYVRTYVCTYVRTYVRAYVGLINGYTVKIRKKDVDQHRNLGGHYMLCSWGEPRHLQNRADIDACVDTIARMNLDGHAKTHAGGGSRLPRFPPSGFAAAASPPATGGS